METAHTQCIPAGPAASAALRGPSVQNGLCNGHLKNGLLELVEFAQQLMGAEYREALALAVRRGAAMPGCERCCIVTENKKGCLTLKTGCPSADFAIGSAITGEDGRLLREMIRKGEGMLSVLTSCDVRQSWLREGLAGMPGDLQLLFVPLFHRGDSLGVMILSFGAALEAKRFSAENLERVRAVGLLVAASLGAAYARKREDRTMAQRERLSMLGENSASVAHTIRNSLTSIGGFAVRLQEKLTDDAADREAAALARQYSAIISAEVHKLEAITRNVLTYARFSSQRLNRRSCNIGEYLAELVAGFGCRYRTVAFDCIQDRHAVTLQLDREAIAVCLEDLVRNAVEAGARAVCVRTKIKPKQKRLLLSVSNDGEEICPTLRDRIFDPFMTTKPDGTGLGLANVRAIVAAHGGEVVVAGTGGRTEFNIYLPID